jgi:hypothetical protein
VRDLRHWRDCFRSFSVLAGAPPLCNRHAISQATHAHGHACGRRDLWWRPGLRFVRGLVTEELLP